MSIVVENLSFTYGKKTPYKKQALKNVSFTVQEGEFVGIIGHTGSGKSTLIQHINGLIKLEEGKIKVFDIDLSGKKPDLKLLRRRVGMVFQYPEYQLFDETVEKDVAFGPKNLKMSDDEIKKSVREAIELVGLDYESIKDKSPFEISGGQKRRVAIAGVIAMKPKVLILDEPTAGLDPKGKEEILELVLKLKENSAHTVIMIGHDIDELSRYVKRLIVLNDGQLVYDTTPSKLFENREKLEEMGLDVSVAYKLKSALDRKGISMGEVANEEDFVKEYMKLYKERKN